MDRYLIVADDFTGSNDTGVQLKRRGIDTSVVFTNDLVNTDSSSMVIDTESRGMVERDAYNKIKGILKDVDFSQFKYIVKKVDSTLRGNVAEEIKAVDEAYNSDLVIFAPALPDLNRTTVGGIHMLKNIPITGTEMAKDPIKPVKEDNITKILEKVYSEKVTHISLEKVEAQDIDLSNGRVFTFDAVTNQDMKNIIKTGINTGKRVLWVGTAAMADNLLEVQRGVPPVLAIVASLSKTTREQVRYAEDNGISLVRIPVYEVIEKKVDPNLYVYEAVRLLKEGKDTMILSSASYDYEEYIKTDQTGEKLGMSKEDVSVFTQYLIGNISERILEEVEISGTFLTGGDTAIGFFNKVGSLGSSILSEIAVGVPMMRLVGGPFEGLKVITKAGAFGQKDVIIYAARKLKEVVK